MKQIKQYNKILFKNYDDTEFAKKLSVGIEASHNSVMLTDKEGIIEYVNPRTSELTGYSSEELIGQSPKILRTEFNTVEMYRELWREIKAGRKWRGEFCNKKKKW